MDPTITPIGSPLLGIIIPGVVLIVSIAATYLLYRHFSKGDGPA